MVHASHILYSSEKVSMNLLNLEECRSSEDQESVFGTRALRYNFSEDLLFQPARESGRTL